MAGYVSMVERCQFFQENTHRPPIGDDVMQGEKQYVVFVLQTDSRESLQSKKSSAGDWGGFRSEVAVQIFEPSGENRTRERSRYVLGDGRDCRPTALQRPC